MTSCPRCGENWLHHPCDCLLTEEPPQAKPEQPKDDIESILTIAGLHWMELDILLSYIANNRKELIKHMKTFGYPKDTAKQLLQRMEVKLSAQLMQQTKGAAW